MQDDAAGGGVGPRIAQRRHQPCSDVGGSSGGLAGAATKLGSHLVHQDDLRRLMQWEVVHALGCSGLGCRKEGGCNTESFFPPLERLIPLPRAHLTPAPNPAPSTTHRHVALARQRHQLLRHLRQLAGACCHVTILLDAGGQKKWEGGRRKGEEGGGLSSQLAVAPTHRGTGGWPAAPAHSSCFPPAASLSPHLAEVECHRVNDHQPYAWVLVQQGRQHLHRRQLQAGSREQAQQCVVDTGAGAVRLCRHATLPAAWLPLLPT